MSSPTGPLVNEVLAGLVERVTFHNSDTGFCVLRIKARHLDFFFWKDFPSSMTDGMRKRRRLGEYS